MPFPFVRALLWRPGPAALGKYPGPRLRSPNQCILLLYMAALRTQIYLTQDQRKELDARAEREGASLAELIREAVDEYLDSRPASIDEALASTFGAAPDAQVPSRSEWDQRVTAGG